MKFLSYPLPDTGEAEFGVLLGDVVLNVNDAIARFHPTLTAFYQDLQDFIQRWGQEGGRNLRALQDVVTSLGDHDLIRLLYEPNPIVYPRSSLQPWAPLPQPRSIRDFYAFEQHVRTANANRGREVPPEWYEVPVFYFSNAASVIAPDDMIAYPKGSSALDYELEVAAVVGLAARDVPAERAAEHIFGYMIYNDWSARDLQAQEMRVGLGPAKGKDFAQGFGPYLVTPDELQDRATGRPGVYDLAMVARVNGVERSRGNWADLHYDFGQMLARAAQNTQLWPGEVLGSGTVGTGCLLELTQAQGPYLQAGDVVELEIERLGVLRQTVGVARG